MTTTSLPTCSVGSLRCLDATRSHCIEPRDGQRTSAGDIAADPKFYPDGAAKAFFTAHNCKDPVATKQLLDVPGPPKRVCFSVF